MEPTTQIPGYRPPEDPAPAPGWWKASDGRWYPPTPPTPPVPGPPTPWASPGNAYGWAPPGSSGPGGPSAMPPQWGVPLWQAPPSTGNGFSITAIVLGAVAFVFIPPLFGILGLIFGAIGLNRKERLGRVGMIVAGLGLVMGIILGVVFVAVVRQGG
jgi:hypothetical protein